MGDFGGDMGFMHCLVRQHRLAHDVADRKDMRHVGTHLPVDVDEAPVGHGDTGLVGADLLAIRASADRHQHEVVDLRSGRRLLALEADLDAGGGRLGADRLGLQHDLVEALGVHLLPDLTRSRSAPCIRPSSISTTSMRVPSVEYTVAISSPMMPPPITSMRFGIDLSCSAPVESTMRGSS